MSADLNQLIPELREPAKELVNLAGRAGVQPRVTSTVRSHSQQQRLYNAYLRGESHYPVAPPGHSAHEYGYAFDLVCDTAENLHDLGTVWQQWGGIWHATDEVHFEYPGFSPTAALMASAPASSCSTFGKISADVVDLALGFLPVVGEVELVSWLLSLGFPQSEVLKFLQSPTEYVVCR